MAYLARQPTGTRVKANDVAKEINAPSNYLGKLMQVLAQDGLLESQKGHGGGFSLARSPKKITLFDVLQSIDGIGSKPICFFGWKECSDAKPCAVHHEWLPRRDAMNEFFKTVTIKKISDGEIFS
jgi:Rrf2 family protein